MALLMQRLGYALNTERTYCDWVAKFIKFNKLKSRDELFSNAEAMVERYLSFLASNMHVASSTQNQAMNALVFLYTKVLNRPLENISARRSRKEPRIPVVLAKEEIQKIIPLLDGVPALVVKILYGGGLRITEAVRLRVQDLDFAYKQITVRDGKGKKDRVTPIAESLLPVIKEHLKKVEVIHNLDIESTDLG